MARAFVSVCVHVHVCGRVRAYIFVGVGVLVYVPVCARSRVHVRTCDDMCVAPFETVPVRHSSQRLVGATARRKKRRRVMLPVAACLCDFDVSGVYSGRASDAYDDSGPSDSFWPKPFLDDL